MEEIESAIDDGSPITDIGEAIANNPSAVAGALAKIAGRDGAEEQPEVEDKNKAHYVSNELPRCTEIATSSSMDEWSIVTGMSISAELKDDHLAIIFYSMTGEFLEEEEGPTFAVKAMLDDVE